MTEIRRRELSTLTLSKKIEDDQMLKTSITDVLATMPGPSTTEWPNGEPFAPAMQRGTMLLEVFAPRGKDTQTPHSQDELYLVVQGTADFAVSGKWTTTKAGDALFVAAGTDHRFHRMSEDFMTWVVFWGPEGGE